MSENKEQVLQEIQAILKGKPLETFDVREHVFAQVEKDSNDPNNKNKTKKEKKEEFECDKDIFDEYDGRNRLLIKTAIGKKWAVPFNYDYDAAYFANLIYKAAFFPSGVIEPLRCVEKYEYVTVCDGHYFRGDTMNSWFTTLNEYFRLFGEKHLRYLTKTKRGPNTGKWCIPESCPPELIWAEKKWKNIGWIEYLSIPEVYTEVPLPPYITKFLECVYTIGNFIPVPLAPNFNTCRSGLCHDYWDLTLRAIYQHYAKNYTEDSDDWKNLLSREGVKHWLDRYGSWDAFVEGNFLQDFVHEERAPYGKPKESERAF